MVDVRLGVFSRQHVSSPQRYKEDNVVDDDDEEVDQPSTSRVATARQPPSQAVVKKEVPDQAALSATNAKSENNGVRAKCQKVVGANS